MKRKLVIVLFLGLAFAGNAFAAADPLASAKTQAVLAYLSGLASGSANRVISGQFTGGQHYMSSECTAVYNATGMFPGIMGVDYSPIYGGSGTDFTEINNTLINWSNANGIVLMLMHTFNPVTHRFFNPDGSHDNTTVDILQLVTSGTALNTTWKAELDRVALGLSNLQSNNVVVLFRPFHEMNGSWFWWGGKSANDFKNLWIYTFNYLTTTKGLHNLIWVYGPNDGSDAASYYPGASYVDLVGFDYYGSMSVPTASGYTELLPLKKPVAMTEFGPCSASGSGCGSQDSRPLIAGIKANMPNLIFWMNYGGVWALGQNTYVKELLQDPWVITRNEIPVFGGGTAPAAPTGLKTVP